MADWLLFAVTAVSFTLFLRSWMALKYWRNGETDAPSPALSGLAGISMFTWLYMRLDMTWATNPDLMIPACVFMAGWCLIRMAERPDSWAAWCLLGAVLGVAYYSKPAGLHIAVLLFATLLFTRWDGAARKGLAAAVLCFCALAVPLIGALSARAGQLTISESGKLNYVWHTNDFYMLMGWTGQDRAVHGTPMHAPRVISRTPAGAGICFPGEGTYPLWFDPSYWYDGVRVEYDVKRQIAAIGTSLLYYYSFDAYYAHYARLQIVAQAPDPLEFQGISPDRWNELIGRLRTFHVKAIIAPDSPAGPGDGWTELPPREGVGYRALLLK